MLKSDMGKFVPTIGVLTLLAVWKGGTCWAAALIANAAITVTRIMSTVQDGFTPEVNFAIRLEGFVSVIVLILLLKNRASRTALN